MRTKKISLFYKVTKDEVLAPRDASLIRKEAWIKEIQKTIYKKLGERFIKVTYELFNPEVENMRKFFNGPVVDYWTIQKEDMLTGTPPRTLHDRARETILSNTLGYEVILMDRREKRRRSTSEFLSTQKWHDFLETLRETEFDPNGYEFPDSEEFWRLAKEHGVEKARAISIEQLQHRIKAKLSP